jgi:hypothetical protein
VRLDCRWVGSCKRDFGVAVRVGIALGVTSGVWDKGVSGLDRSRKNYDCFKGMDGLWSLKGDCFSEDALIPLAFRKDSSKFRVFSPSEASRMSLPSRFDSPRTNDLCKMSLVIRSFSAICFAIKWRSNLRPLFPESFYYPASTCFKNITSCCSLFIVASSTALISALRFLYITCFTRSQNLRVFIVSSTLETEGIRQASKVVFVPPQNESCKSLVNWESR